MNRFYKIGPRFVVFEGIEACGKSTQIKKLADYLRSKGEKVWVTCEPTNSSFGQEIRRKLQDVENLTSNLEFAELFAKDRELHEEEIIHHLSEGEWIICDRYLYSTLAYQCYGDHAEDVRELNESFVLPNFIFYIDVPVSTSLTRIKSRNGVEECFDKEESLLEIRNRYEELFSDYTDTHLLKIDGDQGEDEVWKEIKDVADSKSFHETSSSILRILRRW